MLQIIKPLLLTLLSEECFTTFFEDFNFFDVDCLKATLSKGLGLGIVLGSVLVKLPQILKITAAKSGQGIALAGIILELLALLSSVSYNFVNQYPFSSYGDGVFLVIQNILIYAFVLHYDGKTDKALAFVVVATGSWLTLCSGFVPLNILWALQAANIPVVFAGKMVQAVTNYNNGSTGQLSAVTLVLLFLGSLARIFTSVQETGDSIIILTYIVSSFANGILMGQLIYYWNVKPASKKE